MRNQQNRCGLKNTSYFHLLPSLIIVLMMISGCGGSGGGNHRTDDIDTNPPVLSNGSPTGALPAGTTETNIFVTSNENATCKYDMSAGIDYDLKSNMFQNTGGTSHSTAVTGLVNGQSFTYYVRCRDSSGNVNEIDYPISFFVENDTTNGIDTSPPVLSNGSPTGALPAGTTETNIFVTSNENATCKYDTNPGIDYSLMSNMFQNTGGTSHVTPITGLQNGHSFTYYVRCQDLSGNVNENDYPISFSVNSADPTITINKIYTMNAGNILHATTRGTIDLVHRYQGVWFVFHGANQGGNGFQTSTNGNSWSSLKTGVNSTTDQLSRSYLIEGDSITKVYNLDLNPDPNIYNTELYICEGTISGADIVWDVPQVVMPADTINGWAYYIDIKRDALGRIHISGRHDDGVVTDIFWMRAQIPNDNSLWEIPFIVLSGGADTGTDGHENIQLSADDVYVIGRSNSKVYVPGHPAGFYGRYFNGTNWEPIPTELGVSDGIGGSDRRLSAIFDPNTETIHLVYIDNHLDLYHRTLSAPYNSSDWSIPELVESNVFTCTMGIDRTVSPSRLALVYGDQHADDGGRLHTGELYLKWFNGQIWETTSLLISEPGTIYNWYPNMIRDVSGDIGVMYQKGDWNASMQDIMFSLIEY